MSEQPPAQPAPEYKCTVCKRVFAAEVLKYGNNVKSMMLKRYCPSCGGFTMPVRAGAGGTEKGDG